MMNIIITLMDPLFLILVFSSLGTFLTVLAVGLHFVDKTDNSSRLKTVKRKRAELKKAQSKTLEQKTLRQRINTKSLSEQILERLNLQQLIKLSTIKNMMLMAGFREKNAASIYVFSHIVLPFVLSGLAYVLCFKMDQFKVDPQYAYPALIFGFIAGFGLPYLIVKNTIIKRQEALDVQFPDALDLLLVCVEAGLSVEAAFIKVTDEMAEGNPQIAVELGLTGAELAFLGDRRQAYENMSSRTGLAQFKSLATSLIQSEKYGTPVASSLRVLSEESRRMRTLSAEKKAGALPAKLTVPMIVFFLPVLLAVIIAPAVIQLTR